MSQMPDTIYLHKDAKYNTSGQYFAQDENNILFENNYDESVMKEYVEYTPIYRLEEAVEEVKKNLALTCKDIRFIIQNFHKVVSETENISSEEAYIETLKIFIEQRKK